MGVVYEAENNKSVRSGGGNQGSPREIAKIESKHYLLFAVLMVSFLVGSLRAQDVPNLGGPPLRHFDPKKDCKCVESSLKRKRALRDAYKKLAESYKGFLIELGQQGRTPTRVDLTIMTAQQRARLAALNTKFDEEEQTAVSKVPAAEHCGFPEDTNIVLKTNLRYCAPPTPEQQRSFKPLFPFEELYDAVMLHEYHHAGECARNNMDIIDPVPRTLTPYGRALEEAAGYQIEIDALGKLAKKCKLAMRIDARAVQDASNAGGTLHAEWTYSGVATPKPEIPLRLDDEGTVAGESPANIEVLYRQEMAPKLDPHSCITEGHARIIMKLSGTIDDRAVMHIKITAVGSVPVTQTCVGKLGYKKSEVWPYTDELVVPEDIPAEIGAKKEIVRELGMTFSTTVEIIQQDEEAKPTLAANIANEVHIPPPELLVTNFRPRVSAAWAAAPTFIRQRLAKPELDLCFLLRNAQKDLKP
jgi:hypothetical protein